MVKKSDRDPKNEEWRDETRPLNYMGQSYLQIYNILGRVAERVPVEQVGEIICQDSIWA